MKIEIKQNKFQYARKHHYLNQNFTIISMDFAISTLPVSESELNWMLKPLLLNTLP